MFYTMGEVTEMFDVNSSLIRYWEKQFNIIKPVRNKKGNRLFTPKDVENFKLIYHLVKEKGMTLEGAKKSLRSGKLPEDKDLELMDRLLNIRSLLLEVREVLKEPDSDEEANEEVVTAPAEPTDTDEVEESIEAKDEDVEGGEGEESVAPAAPRTRRTKGESGEKELFAFYEQNLF